MGSCTCSLVRTIPASPPYLSSILPVVGYDPIEASQAGAPNRGLDLGTQRIKKDQPPAVISQREVVYCHFYYNIGIVQHIFDVKLHNGGGFVRVMLEKSVYIVLFLSIGTRDWYNRN